MCAMYMYVYNLTEKAYIAFEVLFPRHTFSGEMGWHKLCKQQSGTQGVKGWDRDIDE